tara:strand:- start:212 stop:1462 length:1251 start_codon:yes stop_codon:yes gene_type:complete
MSGNTFADFSNLDGIDTDWLTTYGIDLNNASYADFTGSENFTGSFDWTDYSGSLLNSDTSDTSSTTNKQYKSPTITSRPKRALRKINGGRVLKYPIDIDVNLQDYFEMQVFKYRPAGRLPTLSDDTEEQYRSDSVMGGYNRRDNRQNLRLQELQSTIQIPIPNSLSDTNAVDWGEQKISSLVGQIGGPLLNNMFTEANIGTKTEGDIGKLAKSSWDRLWEMTAPGNGNAMGQFRKRAYLNAMAAAARGIGVNIDIDQAITRINGTIINPNLELLFNGPALRQFTFTIRFTPRSPEESERIRMIIRVLKQHSAVKKNPISYGDFDGVGTNFLLGTPDVFKLRYIKAKTQKDIKGLNKFKTCALQSVSVDYTGEAGRFAGYDIDSQPVTTLVTLNFTELVPLYDEDYHEFTNDDDVGL